MRWGDRGVLAGMGGKRKGGVCRCGRRSASRYAVVVPPLLLRLPGV